MKTIQIQVPDMQSNHCQMRVKQAVNNLTGIQVTQIQAGSLTVDLGNTGELNTVSAAIQNAGYKVSQPEETSSVSTTKMEEGETYRFRTNINCGGCLSQVRPALDAAEGICHWNVDIADPEKILSVHAEGISRDEIMETVRKTGFAIEEM